MTLPRVQDYRDLAHDYDETRYVGDINRLKEGFRRQALRVLLPSGRARALDVACGTGRGVLILRDVASSVFGIDGTREMLQFAQRKIEAMPHVGVCQGNAALMPFRDGTFDVVTCLNFVHLFDGVEKKRSFVAEIGRVLKPGGVAVVEFDSAFQGVALGALRKYFGRDIGYDWPWTIRGSFPKELFEITAIRGSNLPGIWRIPFLRSLEQAAGRFPVNYLGSRVFVRAVRR